MDDWVTGGCHCGAVRFRVALETREALDCNCSICRKKGILHYIVPPARFELLQGRDALSTYRFNTGVAQHHFCRHCGMHPFYRPRSHPDSIDVNLRCLDDDLLSTFEIRGFDGRRWEASVHTIRGPDALSARRAEDSHHDRRDVGHGEDEEKKSP